MILYDKKYLKSFRYGQSMQDQSEYSLRLLVWNICKQSIKLSNNEMRETFYEGLKWMCKLFEINAQHNF